ncbi:PAS domain S-box protein [Geodermatophilus sp. SYSU D00684]
MTVGGRVASSGDPVPGRVLDRDRAALLIVDTEDRVGRVNPGVEQLFGYPPGEVVGGPVDVLVPDRCRAEVAQHLERCRATRVTTSLQVAARRRDGTEVPVELTITPLGRDPGNGLALSFWNDAQLERALGVVDDSVRWLHATERARVTLLTHLVRAQDEERRRIAADVRDHSILAIAVASLRLQQLRRRLSDPGDRRLLTRLEESMQLAVGRLHHLVCDLRRPGPERGGSLVAVQQCLQQLRADTGATVGLDHGLSGGLPVETRALAYRLTQEALTDVRRYARVSTVHVRLHEVSDGVLAIVADDGVGDPADTAGSDPVPLGLTLLHERVEIAGGWCRIERTPGAGATVEFWIPRIDEATDRAEPHNTRPEANHERRSCSRVGGRRRSGAGRRADL